MDIFSQLFPILLPCTVMMPILSSPRAPSLPDPFFIFTQVLLQRSVFKARETVLFQSSIFQNF